MKTSLLLSVVTATVLVASTGALAGQGSLGVEGKNASTQPHEEHLRQTGDIHRRGASASHRAIREEIRHHTEAFRKPPEEILQGLQETMEALSHLQKGEDERAKEALEKAVALFDKALEADPKLALVPIDQAIEVKAFGADAATIKSDILLAQNLLKAYRTQEARDLLIPLEDEIDVTTHYLPMDLYPKAAKEALLFLKKGRSTEAKAALLLGFDTIVADEVVIPIPLLAARELVDEASNMEKKDAKEALKMVETAKKELYKALLLGYTSHDAKAYRTLEEKIATLERELTKGGETRSLFRKIERAFEELLHRERGRKHSLKESGSVWKGTAKAHAKAAREETDDALRFEERMKANDF